MLLVVLLLSLPLLLPRGKQEAVMRKAEPIPTKATESMPTKAAESIPTKAGESMPTLERLEVVATNVTTGFEDDWGPHKARIVRTSTDDIFLAYNADDGYHVMHRSPSGGWTSVHQGATGIEPINIVRGPHDDLHVFTWPDDNGTLVHVQSTDMGKTWTSETVPGQWEASQGYASAGINTRGDIVVIQRRGYQPGYFHTAYRLATETQWHFRDYQFDYGYAYSFVLPEDGGGLSVVASRDVPEATLGYSSCQDCYAINAIKYFHTDDITSNTPLAQTVVKEEPYQAGGGGGANIVIQAQEAYEDTQGRMHILYPNEATGGGRHAIVQNGKVMKEISFNAPDTYKVRLIQDTTGRFYLLGMSEDTLTVQAGAPGDTDGTNLESPISLSLQGHSMTGSGSFRISSPRGGTPLADYVDGHYQSGNSIVYFRLRLKA